MQSKLLILRKERKITQTELAKLLDISTQSYSRKELGQNEFTADEMFTLANYFGLKIEEIFLPRVHQNGVNDGTIN